MRKIILDLCGGTGAWEKIFDLCIVFAIIEV